MKRFIEYQGYTFFSLTGYYYQCGGSPKMKPLKNLVPAAYYIVCDRLPQHPEAGFDIKTGQQIAAEVQNNQALLDSLMISEPLELAEAAKVLREKFHIPWESSVSVSPKT